ncbi:NFRKB family protein [Megaselia abdita]
MQEHGFDSDASDFTNESGSTSSGTTSLSTSSDESNKNTKEVLVFQNETFSFPKNILDNPMIFKEFFSIETWKSLPENYRLYLKNKYLPSFPNDNSFEKERSVHMLFSNNIQRFNTNAFVEAYKRLEEGNFRPEIFKLRKSIAKSRRREQKFKEYERISQLAKYLMIAREKLLCNAYNRPLGTKKHNSLENISNQNLKEFRLSETLTAMKARRRYCKELTQMTRAYGITDLSDEEIFECNSTKAVKDDKEEDLEVVDSNEVRILKTTKRKKKFNLLEANSCLLNSKTLKEALLEHKRRKLESADRPEMDINDIRLRDIYTRTQISFEVKKNPIITTDNGKKINDSPEEYENLSNNQQSNKLKNSDINYYLFSESEDDDILNSKQNPSLNETYISNSKKPKNVSSPINQILDNEDFDNKKETKILQQYQGKVSAATVSDLEGIDMMGLPVDLDDSCDLDLYSELNNVADQPVIIKNSSQTAQATALSSNPLHKLSIVETLSSNKGLHQDTHACFLSLIRDIFCSTPNHRMKMEELKEKINIWANGPIAALNEWYSQSENWYSLLPSAINFLTGEYFEPQDDFVPYIEYKINLNIYQWIGAGRDTDNHLLALCKKWLIKKSMPAKVDLHIGNYAVSKEDVSDQISSPPHPRSQTTWKVRPATSEEILDFQSQERIRFEQAHKSFTYRQYGYESVVGPVKGIYAPISNLSKARNVNRLSGNRPNYITVLTLVRDATARLPNGEGSKNDICELLKSSQYINFECNDKEIHSIVSGALDRMLTEKPPCVKFDESRKIWIYLHRNKSESEFDFLHNQNQLKSVLSRKPTTAKKIKNQIKPHTSIIRSLSATRTNTTQSLLKSPVEDNESTPQTKFVQIHHKTPVQKVVMTQSPSNTNVKTHSIKPQQVKVVTTTGIQTVTTTSISNTQILPMSTTSNQIKPIIISTSGTNLSTSQAQQSFMLPVISNNLVDTPQQQPPQIKVLSTMPNTIIANSNILNSKFIKNTTTTSSLALRSLTTSTANQPSNVMPRNIVRITNANLLDSKPKIVSIQNSTLQQHRPVTKTISIVKSAIASPINTSQKAQGNQLNKKIISLSDLQQQQKNVIIQQAVQGGQLIHKIINVSPASSTQPNQNIINPQIIQIQPSLSKNIQTFNIAQTNSKPNISIEKQGNNSTVQLSLDKGNSTNIRTMTVSNKIQVSKQINQTSNINKIIKPTTHIRQTQTITQPVMAKVLANTSNQIITLDSLIQKQSAPTGQTVRIPTPMNISKSGQQTASASLIQISSSQQGQVTQYAVVSGATTSALHKDQNSTTTTSNSTQVVPKVIQAIGSPQMFNTKIIGKSGAANITPVNTIRMVNATNLNLSNFKGKSVIIASTTTSKQTSTPTTSSSSTNQVFIQNSNMVLSGQGMKLQGNVLSSTRF